MSYWEEDLGQTHATSVAWPGNLCLPSDSMTGQAGEGDGGEGGLCVQQLSLHQHRAAEID